MKPIWIWWMGLLAGGLMACSPGRVAQSSAAPNFDLSRYQTFALADPEGPHGLRAYQLAEGGELVESRLVKQLEKRGLRHDPRQPDLLVKLHVDLENKVQTRQTNMVTDPPNYIGQRRFHWSVREVEVGRYQEGTVSVQLIDQRHDRVVWSGQGQRVMPKNLDRWEHVVAKGAEKVMNQL